MTGPPGAERFRHCRRRSGAGKGVRLPKERTNAFLFTEILSPDIGMDMLLIPAGVFTMGSPNYEPERRPNEGRNIR